MIAVEPITTKAARAALTRSWERAEQAFTLLTLLPSYAVRSRCHSSVLFPGRAGPRALGTAGSSRWGAGRGRQARVLRPKRAARADIAASLGIVASATRLVGRNELMLAAANEVRAAHSTQRFAKNRPVIRIVVAQKCLVQPAHLQPLGDTPFFAGAGDALQWIFAGVIHRGRGRHGRWQEGLHLVCAETVLLQPQGELEHVFVGRAGMRGNEVGNQVLLFAGFLGVLVEQRLEAMIRADARLHHLRQRSFGQGLRRDLEITAHVMLGKLFDVLGRLDGEVVTNPGCNQHFLDAGQPAGAPVEFDERRVIGVEVWADRRVYA